MKMALWTRKLMIPVAVMMVFSLFGCGKTEQKQTGSNQGGKTASLSFESFDGGGPEFNVVIADESVVSYSSEAKYNKADHGEMNGAGYDEVITFTGIKPGETTVLIEERSPIADNLDYKYRITVDDTLNVQIEQLSVKDINEEA